MEYLVLKQVPVSDLEETLNNHANLGWGVTSLTYIHSVRPFYVAVLERENTEYAVAASVPTEEPVPETKKPESMPPAPKAKSKQKHQSAVTIGLDVKK